VSWRSVPANRGCFSSVETAPFFVKGQWQKWQKGRVREGRKGCARLDLRGERLRCRDERKDEQVKALSSGVAEAVERRWRAGRRDGKMRRPRKRRPRFSARGGFASLGSPRRSRETVRPLTLSVRQGFTQGHSISSGSSRNIFFSGFTTNHSFLDDATFSRSERKRQRKM
jgi:hypothetical protein